LADTINATSCGGIDVPHGVLSTAKEQRFLDMSKYIRYYFAERCHRTYKLHGNTAGIPVTEPLQVPFEVSHHPRLQVPAQGSCRGRGLRHEAHTPGHRSGVGLRHRGHGNRQGPRSPARQCAIQAIAVAERPPPEAGQQSPHLAAARRHATAHLLGGHEIFWTKGYFVSSIGNVSQEAIKHYIENQG